MSAITIELKDITFSYPGHPTSVYDHLNFSFSEGKIGLIGDNGSGKTTLFHVMVGLLKPDSGSVLFNGTPMETEKDFTTLRRQVGMLFQNADDQLFSPTVLEDVAFGPLNLGYSVEEAKELAHSTLERLGLSGYEDRITHRLSGGEKRTVALATVLAMDPKILLLDEPTNDLDQVCRHRLLDILGNLKQSYLLISHDWDFLGKLTNDFYILENGKLSRSDGVALHRHEHAHTVGAQDHVHEEEVIEHHHHDHDDDHHHDHHHHDHDEDHHHGEHDHHHHDHDDDHHHHH